MGTKCVACTGSLNHCLYLPVSKGTVFKIEYTGTATSEVMRFVSTKGDY